MNPKTKGQVGIETVIIVGLLLVLFAAVLVYNSFNSSVNSQIQENWTKEIECNKFAEIVSSIYNKGHGAEWRGETIYNIVLGANSIFLYRADEGPESAIYCRHFAELPETFTKTGKILVINVNGQVWLKNDTS